MQPPGEPQTNKNRVVLQLVLVILCGLILTAPLLFYGLPNLGNDAGDHVRWDRNFAMQFWAGDLYPRWLMNSNSGLGSPVMLYVPPMQSYAVAALWPILHGFDPSGWFASGYACVLASVLSGLAAYIWLKLFVDSWAAVFGAVIYMLAPYHLAIDLYNRGDAGEFWVFVWLPLMMLSADGITRRVKYSAIGLAVSYGLCVYAHAAVAECSAPLPLAYVLFFSDSKSRIRATLVACGAIGLGIGFSAVYLAPAFLDRYKSWTSQYTGGWNDYRNWWLFDLRTKLAEEGGQAAGIPWYLGYKMRTLVITLWTVLFCAVSWWIVRRSSPVGNERRLNNFYFGVILFIFFMMLRQSDFVWRIFSLLQYIVYPSRMLCDAALATAALGALSFQYLKQRGVRLAGALVLLTVLGWGLADAGAAWMSNSNWRHIPAERALRARALDATEMEQTTFWPLPSRANVHYPIEKYQSFIQANTPRASHLDVPGGTVTVKSWQPRRILLKVDLPAAGHLTLNHFYMKGWQTRPPQGVGEITVTPSNPEGFIEASLPAGSYELPIELPLDHAETIGLAVTLASIGVLAVMAISTTVSARARRVAAQA